MMFDSSAEYFTAQDDFVRYIAETVNPVRKMNKLTEIDERMARECFRIIDNLFDPATKRLTAPPST